MSHTETEVLHLWRLVELCLGPGGVSRYVCELGGETLCCPPADEPLEC